MDIQEDEAILESEGGELSVRTRNAVVLRLEEKLMLQENIDHLMYRLGGVSSTGKPSHTRSEL